MSERTITADWVIGYFPSNVDASVKQTICDAFEEYAAIHPAAAPQPKYGGLPKLQRYFPSKPAHPGWEMSPHDDGEWFLWEDLSKWWNTGPFVVSKFEGVGLDAQQPISYSVKGCGMIFTCGVDDNGERKAQWLAAHLNVSARPSPEGVGDADVVALVEIVLKQCGGYLSGPAFEAAELARAVKRRLTAPQEQDSREGQGANDHGINAAVTRGDLRISFTR